ncbi:MAG: stage II sporulation protein R [Clostridia bacterium]|nr:stage II sporulation protein R [Clostridia bacterium]
MVNIFSFIGFSQQCDDIRNKVLRMHVIANSDENYDQKLKLKVRDAVLNEGGELFDGSLTADDAEEKIKPNIKRLEDVAIDTVRREGYDYDVRIYVVDEFFKTRVYENSVTLPAGEYTAIKVVIGEGKGENWWCVMFPPMCLPSASENTQINDVLNEEEIEIVSDYKRYTFKFKFLEIYKELTKKFK